MRRQALAALALLLAGRASAGPVLGEAAAAPSVAASAAAACVSAPLPLSNAANLTGPAPTLAAASSFLRDSSAQSWLEAHRPRAYPALVAAALNLDDWRQTLAAHEDPRLLREAVLARADDPIGANPSVLMGLVDRDPALAENRRLYEIAALEWNALSEPTRAALTQAGHGERGWSALELPARYDAVRAAHNDIVVSLVTAAPGSPEFAAQYEAALRRARAVMTDAERDEHAAELARAHAVAEGLVRAERASAAAGGIAASLLAEARAAGSLDEAAARVDAALAALGQAPAKKTAAPKPALNLTPEETKLLSARMADAFAAELSGVPLGEEILAALRERPASILVGPTLPDIAAVYSTARVAITVSERELAEFAAAQGRDPRDLLSDARLRADAALFFSPFFVHEGEHHRQFTWARAHGLGGAVYSQQWETEAYLAQAAFIRQKRAADPRFAALQARLRPVLPQFAAELDLPDEIDRDAAAHRLWLARTYRTAPTLSRAGSRVIAAGLNAAEAARAPLSAIEAELAARRRLDARARAALESGPAQNRTGALRRERDRLARLAADALNLSADLMDRSRAEIRRLEAARRPGTNVAVTSEDGQIR